MRFDRRLLVFVLSAILAIGLPVFTPYAMAADEHCSMSQDRGSTPERDTNCAQYCAAVCAGMVLPSGSTMAPSFATERVLVFSVALFESHAGPPVLQPPR